MLKQMQSIDAWRRIDFELGKRGAIGATNGEQSRVLDLVTVPAQAAEHIIAERMLRAQEAARAGAV